MGVLYQKVPFSLTLHKYYIFSYNFYSMTVLQFSEVFQNKLRNPETYVLFEQKPFFCLILFLIVFQHLFSIKIEVIAREYKPSLPLFFISLK